MRSICVILGRRDGWTGRDCGKLLSLPRNLNRWQGRLRYNLFYPYLQNLTSSAPRCRHFYFPFQNRISLLPAGIWSGQCNQVCYLLPGNRAAACMSSIAKRKQRGLTLLCALFEELPIIFKLALFL